MALNLYYFAMMIPGIVCWRRNRDAADAGSIVRTRLSGRERAVWSAAILAGGAALWGILLAVGGNRPLCDAFTNVLSIAAMALTVKRCIEQWVMWLAVDAIEMFMWWQTGAESMAILAMWTLFFVDGCYCFGLWYNTSRCRR
jgi:nicotinamide mononucleotide transporter